MSWTAYLHPALMLVFVFPAGLAALLLGLQLQQVRTGTSRGKPKTVRDRHIGAGVVFFVSLVAVAVVGGFVAGGLPETVDYTWHGLGAALVIALLVTSTALVTVRSLKRLGWARLVHSILNGAVIALLVVQFLSGGLILRGLLRG